MTAAEELAALERQVTTCRRCPRLVAWREEVARVKRASFAGQEYWGRPVPGFGDPAARLLIVGLAPAAHGGNRTGRIFTGDRSGDWLFAALYRAGLANQPDSVSRDDGLRLRDCYITAAVRCAPPANRPTTTERNNCLPYLARELELLTGVKVIVALGGFAWDATLRVLSELAARSASRLAKEGGARFIQLPRPKPRFGHGAEARLDTITLVGCYHPSQQNTFTGRLTTGMMDEVLGRAKTLSRLTP